MQLERKVMLPSEWLLKTRNAGSMRIVETGCRELMLNDIFSERQLREWKREKTKENVVLDNCV